MIKWHYNEKECMIFATFTGEITKEEIINYLRDVSTNPNLPENLKIYEDASSANFMFDIEANEEIRIILSEIIAPFSSLKCASVQNTPKEFALATDYEIGIPYPNFRYKVFTKKENAKAWLNSLI